ncbi:hypothetical protein D9M68_676510 [compost metagenome]
MQPLFFKKGIDFIEIALEFSSQLLLLYLLADLEYLVDQLYILLHVLLHLQQIKKKIILFPLSGW